MVLARTKRAASELSQQIRDGIFEKEYQAVLHGIPAAPAGTLRDLLYRNKPERKTYVVSEPGRDVQEAILNYEVLSRTPDFSKVRNELAQREVDEEAVVIALLTKEGLSGAAYAISGARALRSSCITGVVVHMIGGILGMLAVLALTIVGAEEILTPVNILLYDLIWLVPALLFTEWTRSV